MLGPWKDEGSQPELLYPAKTLNLSRIEKRLDDLAGVVLEGHQAVNRIAKKHGGRLARMNREVDR